MKKCHPAVSRSLSEGGPDKMIEEYYRKGLKQWKQDKRGVYMKDDGETLEPMTYTEAAALVTADLTEKLPHYRREMLKAKAKRQAAVFLMPRWFVMPSLLTAEGKAEHDKFLDLFDDDKGILQKMCAEKGLYCYFSAWHTDNPNVPVLLAAFLIENIASE